MVSFESSCDMAPFFSQKQNFNYSVCLRGDDATAAQSCFSLNNNWLFISFNSVTIHMLIRITVSSALNVFIVTHVLFVWGLDRRYRATFVHSKPMKRAYRNKKRQNLSFSCFLNKNSKDKREQYFYAWPYRVV